MEIFKLLGTIAINNSDAISAIKDTAKQATKLGDSVSKSSATAETNLSQIAAESGKTMNQICSEVETAAAEYRKQGVNASDAMKKAYEDIGYSAENAHEKMSDGVEDSGAKLRKLPNIIGGVTTALEKAGSVAGTVASKVGTVIAAAAKVGVAAVGVASAGVTALTKNAVNNYADYEQLVGGVETLFGDSANIIKNYALEAYQTAGLNANDYMETVTGFSASLLQGLGGDTAKAAEYANRAITDMSDNANKMGTDMTSIQNAYQGFAKQNYTMLDNLKLGYGGTKEEMQRLIKEASKMTDVQKDLGVTVDESSLSFDNIINAISVVQKNMDITGTTAKEASETISGSISSMKASWQNLVGAMANKNADLTYFINNFVESVKTVKDNILPVVKTAVSGIGTLVSELAPVISEAIPELVTEVIPDLLDAGLSVVEALADGIIKSIPALVEQAPVLIRGFMNALDDLAWMLWDVGSTIVTELGASILENGQLIVGGAIENLIIFLGEKLGVSEETLESFRGMLETACESISDIFQAVKDLVENVADTVSNAISETGITWGDVWDGISTVLSTASDLIVEAVDLVSEAVSWVAEKFGEAKDALQPLIDTVSEYVDSGELANDVTETMETVIEAAKDAVGWLAEKFEAVKEKLQPYIDAVSDYITNGELANDVITAMKDALDLVSDVITAVVDGVTAFSDWCTEHQTTVEVITTLIGALAAAIGLYEIGQLAANIATTVWTTISGIATAATTALSTAVAFLTSPITLAIAALAALIAIGVLVAKNWDKIKETCIKLAQNISEKFTEIKEGISEKLTAAKEKVSEVFDNIKTTISDKLTSAKETVTDIFDNIKESISEKIESAKTKVSDVIDAIKELFNFSWSLPKLELPHISISGKFSLSPLSVPSFSISWYKKAMDNPMIMESPTPFGINKNGQIMAGGEAGSEVVSGTQTLMDMISAAVAKQNDELAELLASLLNLLESYMPQIISEMGRDIVLNNGVLVGELTPEIDRRLGTMSKYKARGN